MVYTTGLLRKHHMRTTASTLEADAFYELMESRISELLSKIENASLQDIDEEWLTIRVLIDIYRRNDQLLEGLLSPTTTKLERKQIREALAFQRIRIATNRVELERLYAKSHKILQRSVEFLAAADRLVYKRQNNDNPNAPEICGYCMGIGNTARYQCRVCKGKRTVLVNQPPIVCPSCKGTGRWTTERLKKPGLALCKICRGTGWERA